MALGLLSLVLGVEKLFSLDAAIRDQFLTYLTVAIVALALGSRLARHFGDNEVDSALVTGDLESVHVFFTGNRGLLAQSEHAGCFNCRKTFKPRAIVKWVGPAQDHALEGATAVCPKCGIDAVLPSAAPIKLDHALLEDMHQRWFQRWGS